MAYAVPYVPAYSFTQFQTSHPSDPLPASQVDTELFSIATFAAEIQANLALIQRSDGALANNSVGAAQLQTSLAIGINVVATWLTATAYVVNNFIYAPNGDIYQCVGAHTSTVFATDLANGYWKLVVSFATAVSAASAASASATAAAASAAAALVSQNAAAASATALKGTSATSNSIGTGAKTFTTQSGLSFAAGANLQIASAANPTVNNMFGTVTSYSGTSLVMSISVINGSGTYTDWQISLSGARGATGATGPAGPGGGDMLAANNLNDVASVSSSRVNLGLGTAAQQANSFFAQTANNLSDLANKPTALANLSGLAIAAAAATYAPIASPTFSGVVTLGSGAIAATPATNDNSTSVATTAYVKAQPPQIMTALGIGSIILGKAVSVSVTAGQTLPAANVTPYNASGSSNGDVITGTWLALQANNTGVVTPWQRIS